MRIVMVVGRSTGGIGTHVGQLTAELRRLGHDVVIVTDPLTAQRFGWDEALRWWPAGREWVRWLPRVRRLLAGADVVHAHGLKAGTLVACSLGVSSLGVSSLVGRRRRPRSVLSLHNSLPSSFSSSLPGSLHGAVSVRGTRARVATGVERLVVRSADLVTGASSDLVAVAVALGARAVELAPVPSPRVPGLLDQPLASAGDRAALAATLLPRTDGSLPLVLTISRIAPQKSLDVLVAAAAALRTPVVWAVVGDGDRVLLGRLEDAALGTGVRFVGPSKDVSTWLRAATVFVLPSVWEARALVVQEAMAAGTPVVATDVGGLRDLVGAAGVLVPVARADALARAVEDLLGDPERRAELSGRGREQARTWPDGEATAVRWVSWYAPDAGSQ